MSNINSAEWTTLFENTQTVEVLIHPLLHAAADGTQQYAPPWKCRSIVLKRQYKHSDGTPGILLTLLLENTSGTASPGSRIEFEGNSYEIDQIDCCYTVSGNIAARRCTVK